MEVALRIMKTDKANLQVFGLDSGALQIAAQRGFSRPFLVSFDTLHEGEAACGQALKTRMRIIVEDVTESVVFRGTDALEVLLDARVRASNRLR
jgi:hypothetical protein